MDTKLPHTRLDEAQLAPLGSLDDPTRRRLYEYVAASGAPVSRDQAAVQSCDRRAASRHGQ